MEQEAEDTRDYKFTDLLVRKFAKLKRKPHEKPARATPPRRPRNWNHAQTRRYRKALRHYDAWLAKTLEQRA